MTVADFPGLVGFQLFNQDATAFLQGCPPGSIDLICVDPAYESLEKHRAHGTTTRLKHSSASSNNWFEIFKNERFPAWFEVAYRALAKNAHLYVYCDAETMFAIKPMGEAAGFKFWKPIVWDKKKIGMGYHYRARYEFVLFFEKGKRKLNNLGTPDVLDGLDEHSGVDVVGADRVRGLQCGCDKQGQTQKVISRSTWESEEDNLGSSISLSGSGPTGPTDSKISSASIGSPISAFILDANFARVSGGSPVQSAESSSPSRERSGTSILGPSGHSIDADSARLRQRSNSSKTDVCEKCGQRKRDAFPTEKPVKLAEVLIAQSSSPGDVVCDPFMGSGSTGEACFNLGRRFLGNDLSPASLACTRARLNALAKNRVA